MRFTDQEHIAALSVHAGYELLIAEFKKDLAQLEARMVVDSNTEEEDLRLCRQWKALKTHIEKMVTFPDRCADATSRARAEHEATFPLR